MARRAPLTTKQKVLVIAVLACLQSPLIFFVIYLAENPGRFSPKFIALMFALNIIVGVSLLALITEKWIWKIE